MLALTAGANLFDMQKKTPTKIAMMITLAIVVATALLELAHPHVSSRKEPHVRMIGEQFFDTILASSKMQSVRILTTKVVGNPGKQIKTLLFWSHGHGVKDTVLLVQAKLKNGNVADLPWRIANLSKSSGLGWLIVDQRELKDGTVLNVGILRNSFENDGYFVGFKRGVQPREHIDKFSGCFKIASSVPYAVQHNDGVAVTAMASPGNGFRGWCYRYVDVKKNWPHPEYYLHYFAASSSKLWRDVAT